MSTFNDKTLKNVADAVMQIMDEELKGNQHKIDANKNQKIDAHDFKLLRGQKKPPFEGGKEKPETVTDKSGAKHGPMSKARDLARRALRKEQVEQVEESVWDWKSSGTPKKTGETTRTGHDIRKTSTGTVYTKRAQEEKPEDAAPKSRKKQKLGSTSDLMSDEEFKKKHGMSRKNYERMQSGVKIGEQALPFTSMLEAYNEIGLKALVVEEPTEEEFNKELKTSQAKSEGKGKKADVAAAGVKAVKIAEEEEVEQIDEGSSTSRKPWRDINSPEYKELSQNVRRRSEQENAAEPGKELLKKIEKKKMKEEVEQIEESGDMGPSDEKVSVVTVRHKTSGKELVITDKPHIRKKYEEMGYHVTKPDQSNVKEEIELHERTLSGSEVEKREDYVKGMKKKLSGFKKRYGDRAKEVMYATATKMAKED